jgi:hypothetical protein
VVEKLHYNHSSVVYKFILQTQLSSEYEGARSMNKAAAKFFQIVVRKQQKQVI